MKTRVLELNSSDERGINVIREKVKTFSQFTASGQRTDGKPCPPFKIVNIHFIFNCFCFKLYLYWDYSIKVILDEADSMTSSAQVQFMF